MTLKFANLPISSGKEINLFLRKSRTDNLQQLPICTKNEDQIRSGKTPSTKFAYGELLPIKMMDIELCLKEK